MSEVLSGRRTLSLAMIRKLISGLSIPPQVLLEASVPGSAAVGTETASGGEAAGGG